MLARIEHSENFLSPYQRARRQRDCPDWIRQRCAPISSSTGFIKTLTQRRVVLRPLCCASVPTTGIACYKTINSIITLGDSRTAWNAVAESEVRFQVVILDKY
jgi:hypothetical protein